MTKRIRVISSLIFILLLSALIISILVLGDLQVNIREKITGHAVSSYTITPTVISYNLAGAGQLKSAGTVNKNEFNNLYFQDSFGHIVFQQIGSNGFLYNNQILGSNLGTWQLRAIGDLNQDNVTDLFFQDSSGRIAVWYMSPNGSIVRSQILGSNLGTWQLRAVADLNGDKIPDLFYQNLNGNVAFWIMNSSGATLATNILSNEATNWQLRAAAVMNQTFNLFFQDSSGNLAYWIITSSGAVVSSTILSSAAGWQLKSAASNNLYFQSNSGSSIAYWTLGFAPSVFCNGLNYSNWSACSPAGKQTRSVAEKIPINCTVADNQLVQSCNFTCLDSDGGLDYYFKGSVRDSSSSTIYNDSCLSGSSYPRGYLAEKSCSSNGVITSYYLCPSSTCLNGVCIPQDFTPATCSAASNFKSSVGLVGYSVGDWYKVNATELANQMSAAGLNLAHIDLNADLYDTQRNSAYLLPKLTVYVNAMRVKNITTFINIVLGKFKDDQNYICVRAAYNDQFFKDTLNYIATNIGPDKVILQPTSEWMSCTDKRDRWINIFKNSNWTGGRSIYNVPSGPNYYMEVHQGPSESIPSGALVTMDNGDTLNMVSTMGGDGGVRAIPEKLAAYARSVRACGSGIVYYGWGQTTIDSGAIGSLGKVNEGM